VAGEGCLRLKGLHSTDDVKILINDWPYGLARGITHLVVWTKTPIPVGANGDLTAESRERIDEFVQWVFGSVHDKENIMWFKNWRSLQSIPSVEHFHVLVRSASEDMLRAWLEGPWGSKGQRVEILLDVDRDVKAGG